MYLQLAKELYWHIRGPFAQELKYARLRKRLSSGKDLTAYDLDWSQMGHNRISVVNRVISGMKAPVRYLEIGCAYNNCFNSIMVCGKTGVDPAQGGTVRKTSDEFFDTNDQIFDAIFIDGLHTYEQCRQDAMNAFKCLKVGGFVMFHDMLPRNWREEHVPRVQVDWTGDVWKVAVELMQSSGIDFRIIEIDNGVGVARKVSETVAYKDDYAQLKDATFTDYVIQRSDMPIYSYVDSYEWFVS